jgi:hypothetical protein
MKTFAIAASAALVAGVAASPAPVAKRAVQTISVKGNAFFAGDKRFYVRGVDYQPGGSSANEDPIANAANCKRDVANFKALGLNTIRVYAVDNTADHDECMNALADAGIYLALDVNNPKYSINRANPAPSYNKDYLQSVFATIDAFAKYDNTLLFFSGNEVINDIPSSSAAPYVKAVDRDMRSYINARKYRKIPVGYSAADVAENRNEMAAYMNCGPDGTRSDFFAFNDYSWCDPDTFANTDWGQKVKNFSDYSIPLFLSEYGCNKNKRSFNQVAALYSDQMTSVYSGGLVYEYSKEQTADGNFGLVEINGGDVSTLPDFDALKSALQKTPAPSDDGGYKTNGSPSKCPTKSANWNVTIADDQLPAFPSGADEFFTNGAGKGPGLDGVGSQNSGPATESLAPAASGAVTSGSPSGTSSKGAAVGLHPPAFDSAPYVCGLVVLVSTMFGAALL